MGDDGNEHPSNNAGEGEEEGEGENGGHGDSVASGLWLTASLSWLLAEESNAVG